MKSLVDMVGVNEPGPVCQRCGRENDRKTSLVCMSCHLHLRLQEEWTVSRTLLDASLTDIQLQDDANGEPVCFLFECITPGARVLSGLVMYDGWGAPHAVRPYAP